MANKQSTPFVATTELTDCNAKLKAKTEEVDSCANVKKSLQFATGFGWAFCILCFLSCIGLIIFMVMNPLG
jgi:hypothetical protein